jgi:tetratricopeptide (TPR) repeat protein
MQALAIYTVPVPPVAVDYLLQPYRPAVDAAPVLSRLVNMQFVRREAGRYHLHQVDRDYALSRIPAGEPADRDADPAPFTQQALRHRGADYFEQTRTPRENWKTLDDLAPQLAEFELRYQGQAYDTAAQVLLDIDFDYLIRWGHYRLAVEMHQRLQGHLGDPETAAGSKNNLGHCHRLLGKFRRAIDLLEQALAINRKASNRSGQSSNLGNLGICHHELGQIARAIDLFEQALAIDDDIGDQRGKANNLTNLGICCHDLGEIARAIDLFEQALAIHREVGDQEGEDADLGNLGTCHQDLGQLPRAIRLYEQTLAIARQTGNRYAEALALAALGGAHGDLRAWSQAAEYSRQAIDVADAIGSAQAQSGALLGLACIRLLAGDLSAAQQAALAARGHDYPRDRAELSLLLGIAQLRGDQPAEAAREFGDAITQADELLQQASDAYTALDTKALALCGLALTTDPGQAAEATAVFRAARAITSADGIVRAALAMFDALAAADRVDVLAEIRPDAEGRTVTAEPPR